MEERQPGGLNARLSVVIITHNEEAVIGRCLKAARFADEIVVVDSGSSDGTIQICRELADRVEHHDWPGFTAQRNYAIGLATGDWILTLDADEFVGDELRTAILDAVRRDDGYVAYKFARRNSFLGRWIRHGGWYPDLQLRLFRRGAGEYKGEAIHETLVLHDPRAKVGVLAGDVTHETYPTISDFVRKSESYSTVEAGARPARISAFNLVTCFPLKFLEVYVYKQGWRDGAHGFVIAMLSASRVFLRQAKIWERSAR